MRPERLSLPGNGFQVHSIAQHRMSPEVTLDTHVRRVQIALGYELAKRKAVYLDMNFWIELRAANAGKGKAKATELLDLLRKGVESGHLFCPISESVFLELMKQTDPVSREETAALIDSLSLGVTLMDQERRVATEIAHFMHVGSGRINLHPLKRLMWTKLTYVLGYVHPANTGFDPATELALQKAFFDHMWTISLREMVRMIDPSGMADSDCSAIAANLNAGIAAHTHEVRSFAGVYSSEVRGVADLVSPIAVDVMIDMARDQGIELESPSRAQRQESERQYRNLMALALERNRAREALRTMHILASLHASLRWNKGQKFDGNDIFDFNHAAAALAYCDAFFTEKPLRTMVTQSHVALDTLYGCRVLDKVEDAIAWLRTLQGSPPPP